MGSLRSLVHNPKAKSNWSPDSKTWRGRLSQILIRDVPKEHPDVFIDVTKHSRPKHIVVRWKWYEDTDKAAAVQKTIWKTAYLFRLKTNLDLHITFTRQNVCDIIILNG
jgi:hypothetical protein